MSKANIHRKTDSHVFIAGTTGGGKTVTANEAHALSKGLSIFFNSEEEDNVTGFTIHKPGHVLRAIRQHGWNVTLDYRPLSEDKEGLNVELERLVDLLFEIADKTGRKHPIQLLVDECQDYAEQGKSEGALHRAVRKGRKRKIKVMALSQDPARVSKTVVRQCKYNIWCGEFNPYYEAYFDAYNLPVNVLKEQEQTYYTILEKAKPVAKFQQADSRYA